MKKRTVEEKRQMVDNACKLFSEAIEKAREAQRMLHLCGIECCASLNVDGQIYSNNVQLYSGIKKNGVFHRCEIKADPQVTLSRRFWRAPYGSTGTGLAGRGLGRIAILGKACYSDFM